MIYPLIYTYPVTDSEPWGVRRDLQHFFGQDEAARILDAKLKYAFSDMHLSKTMRFT